MMLSSSEAVSSAKATAIISDLRNLKTAALAYFADNFDEYMSKTYTTRVEYCTTKNQDTWDKVLTYLNGKDFPNKAAYKLITSDKGTAWYVECNVGDGNNAVVKGAEAKAVIKKLAGRAKSVGLLGHRYEASEIDTGAPYSETSGSGVGAGGKYVFMLVQ